MNLASVVNTNLQFFGVFLGVVLLHLIAVPLYVRHASQVNDLPGRQVVTVPFVQPAPKEDAPAQSVDSAPALKSPRESTPDQDPEPSTKPIALVEHVPAPTPEEAPAPAKEQLAANPPARPVDPERTPATPAPVLATSDQQASARVLGAADRIWYLKPTTGPVAPAESGEPDAPSQIRATPLGTDKALPKLPLPETRALSGEASALERAAVDAPAQRRSPAL
ncbi:MAG: hypothetical protein IT576_14965 [Verrucomicrobiales bacterium]|nr:hypothetical protein [Verrucomicrobiales bacterium]